MTFYCSSSVSNFKDKLSRRFNLPEWHWLESQNSPVVFFGLYHWLDYLRFLWHTGEKTVFWCGGDILNLASRPWWQKIIRHEDARHICENKVEQEALEKLGITAEIHPCIFDDAIAVESFKPAEIPQVYLCAHKGREGEYGVETIERIHNKCAVVFHIYGIIGKSHDNVTYHGEVPSAQFDEEIRNYQSALRLNQFDGFSEILAKSVLMGQYPISRIAYPEIDTYRTEAELINLLNKLKQKKEPNHKAMKHWKAELQLSLSEILK